MDTDAATLLSRLPVSEVREAERRLRQDVEQKREELRLTVGERYRDLLAAADSMGAMRDAAGRLLAAVTDMRAAISAPDGSTHGGKGASADSTQMLQFYSIAAQVFLIQAVPEVLWHELEAGRPLQAARLCLLSRHILSQLQPRSVPSSTVSVATPLLRRFPILARQAAAAVHFRSAVLAESRAMLRTRAASDVAVAEALCASLLLQEISTRQALADFLLARKAAAQQLLSLTQHGTSIKAQVCALVESIASTLYQVHAVFWSLPAGSSSNSDLPCGLLFEQLSLLASQPVLDGDLLGEAGWSKTWVMHLPDHVREFRPAPSIPCANISPAHLTSTLQHWVDTCKQDVQEGVGRMLCFVRTVKGLAAIRDAAWELLGSQGIGRHWELMCQRLLGKPLFIWDEFLHPVMSQRVEILLKASLDTVVTTAQNSLRETTQNVKSAALDQEPGNMAEQRGAALEQNAGPYLWTEARDDLPQDAAWVGTAKAGEVTKTHDRPLICGLSLKALGVTPVVQAFCTELNAGLGDCLADLATYLPPAPGRDPGQKITVEQVPAAGACIHGDTPHIINELHSETLRCLRLLTDCAKDLPSTAETENGDEARQGLAVTLFLARTFGAIPLLCPALQSCLSGLGESAQSRRGGQEGSSDGSWKEAQALLVEQSLWAYEAWAGGVAESAMAEFSEKMCNATPGAFMANTPKWADMEIQEESETGETVCSKISLPSQASWAVAQLLFRLCQEINAAGGHALPKPPRLALLRSVLDGVLATYRRLLDAVKSDLPMTQKWALQLTFDLRFLHSTFSQKTGATNRIRSSPDPRLEPLLDELEGFVDPFDLDVFTPHIAANLGRLAQRTATVYGLLGTSECLTLPKSSSSTPESHQVLDLSNCSVRFALLPVSSSHGSRHAATPKAEIPQDTVSTQLQAVAEPGTLFQQLADKDSSVGVPSLFTLGWLTGIAK